MAKDRTTTTMPKKTGNAKKNKPKGKQKAAPSSQLGQRSRDEDGDARRLAEADYDQSERQPSVLHEDEFGDDYEQEQMVDDDGLMVDEEEEEEDAAPARFFRPGIDKLEEGEELVFDPSTYVMYHAIKPEWPSLSFDILRDELGGNRTRYPMTMFAVAGSQAAKTAQNKLTLMKLSNLARLPRTRPDDADDENADSEAVVDLEGDDEEEDGDVEADPVLDHVDVTHPAAINRVRSCPQKPAMVATWGDDRTVRVYDLSAHAAALNGLGPKSAWGSTGPCFSFSGHTDEGFALDWSKVVPGQLVSGDCAGKIHVWMPSEGGGGGGAAAGGGGGGGSAWSVETAGRAEHSGSVEDLQWSPSEPTVFISCGVDKSIKVWDVRESRRSMVTTSNAHETDVNVVSWNPSVAYLLASGADDGSFKVWDLRSFGGNGGGGGAGLAAGSGCEPVANFRWHPRAVTSLEWHPSDESVLAVASEDDSISIWDMSVEEDTSVASAGAGGGAASQQAVVPPQLLFVHQGQTSIKELHFHPQCPGVILSTALDGYNIFKPNTNI